MTKIQVRRDTSSNWASANPTLGSGELGFDTTRKLIKVGDGATAWATLGWNTDVQSVDGTLITTSTALQTLITAAAATGLTVRLAPGQIIAMTSTVTIPTQGGIVCDSNALWEPNAPDAMRPQLVAQTGFTGPMLKIGADSVTCQGVRLRGFDVDGNSITGVTYGIYFNTSGTDIENSHHLENIVVRRVTNGTGLAGRIRTTLLRDFSVFQCLVGVKIGAAGVWLDCQWWGGYVALCKNKGIEMAADGSGQAPGYVEFYNLRVERSGQLPFDPKNATTSANWVNTAPGWDITAAVICSWVGCTTDANNGPGFKVSTTNGAGFGFRVNRLLLTNCIFNRDGQDNGTAMLSTSTGVSVVGGSTSGADHPGAVRFINCVTHADESADDLSSTYSAPAYGVTVDKCDHFVWIGAAQGVTKGINFGGQDLWQPMIADNYAQLYLNKVAWTTTTPTFSTV